MAADTAPAEGVRIANILNAGETLAAASRFLLAQLGRDPATHHAAGAAHLRTALTIFEEARGLGGPVPVIVHYDARPNDPEPLVAIVDALEAYLRDQSRHLSDSVDEGASGVGAIRWRNAIDDAIRANGEQLQLLRERRARMAL